MTTEDAPRPIRDLPAARREPGVVPPNHSRTGEYPILRPLSEERLTAANRLAGAELDADERENNTSRNIVVGVCALLFLTGLGFLIHAYWTPALIVLECIGAGTVIWSVIRVAMLGLSAKSNSSYRLQVCRMKEWRDASTHASIPEAMQSARNTETSNSGVPIEGMRIIEVKNGRELGPIWSQ